MEVKNGVKRAIGLTAVILLTTGLFACGDGGDGGSTPSPSDNVDNNGAGDNTSGGAGGDAGEDSGNGAGDGEENGRVGMRMLVPPTCSIDDPDNPGVPLMEWGADGHLEADCTPDAVGPGGALAPPFTVKSGIPNINVVDATREEEREESCRDGSSSKSRSVAKFKEGIVELPDMVPSCYYRMESIVPTTIASGEDVLNLYLWGKMWEKDDITESNCPFLEDDMEAVEEMEEVEWVKCDHLTVINFTVIDDQGMRHNASVKIRGSF